MKNTFVKLASSDNQFTRRWGSRSNTVEPYITGYSFIKFAYMPKTLGDAVTKIDGSQGMSDSAIKTMLASSCLSVTIPGATLSKAEFNGLGNVKWAVPSGVDWDNNCSMRFIEFSGRPIHKIFHNWVKMIRNYSTGASELTGAENDSNQYQKSNYSSVVYYWTTEPNGIQVDYHCCMTGLFPMRDPTDQFGHDITANDKLEIDMDFNVDYLWHEEWTRTKCVEWASNYHADAWTDVADYGVQDSN